MSVLRVAVEIAVVDSFRSEILVELNLPPGILGRLFLGKAGQWPAKVRTAAVTKVRMGCSMGFVSSGWSSLREGK